MCSWLLRRHVASSTLKRLVFCEGALPLVVAFLDQRREVACTTSRILHPLCSSHIDPCNHHADLLARLQGAHRLSTIFCPQAQASKGLMQAAGMAVTFMLSWCIDHCLCMTTPCTQSVSVRNTVTHFVSYCSRQNPGCNFDVPPDSRQSSDSHQFHEQQCYPLATQQSDDTQLCASIATLPALWLARRQDCWLKCCCSIGVSSCLAFLASRLNRVIVLQAPPRTHNPI